MQRLLEEHRRRLLTADERSSAGLCGLERVKIVLLGGVAAALVALDRVRATRRIILVVVVVIHHLRLPNKHLLATAG